MRLPFSIKLYAFGLFGMILISIGSAFATSISMPYSNIDQQSIDVTANDLKPSTCASVFLTNIVSGSGQLMGTPGNDLIIGSPNIDTIDGAGGDDCIIAGNGGDLITGGDGLDVCIGGPGTDTFTTCESTDQ